MVLLITPLSCGTLIKINVNLRLKDTQIDFRGGELHFLMKIISSVEVMIIISLFGTITRKSSKKKFNLVQLDKFYHLTKKNL